MYLTIIFLPLLAALTSGLLGRKLGVKGSYLITTISLIITTILGHLAFYHIGLKDHFIEIKLFNWLNSGSFFVEFGFNFDSLTVSILLPILIVSSLVHLYSIGYMENDPHQQRFFSYLSMFTFFMIILVTANNFLLMFVGWEGYQKRLKWFHCNKFNFSSLNNKKISSNKRIYPHNIDILSLIVGSTLGDTHLEKRKNGIGTRVLFEQSNKNVEYLMWFHNFLSSRGYSTENKPKLKIRIKKNNTKLHFYRINSYTFSSFNWLHDNFYKLNPETLKYRKVVPNFEFLNLYLTPLALAIWFMDDGSKIGKTVRIATNNFYDVELLVKFLKIKYNLKCSMFKGDKNKKGDIIYIWKESFKQFTEIIKPHLLPSMEYKIL